MAAPIPTNKDKSLRACMLCSIVMSAKDFRKEGCPNCEEITKMRGDGERVQSCTSPAFEGVVAMINSESSWVAKWQRTSKFVKGIYAVRVSGVLPDDVIDELSSREIIYRPRDQNTVD